MPRSAITLRSQQGFTIIEVMVAAMLLLVGMLGTVALVERADDATATTKFREGGNGLAREVLEQVRTVPYPQLNTTGVVTALQAVDGLGTTGAPGTWTVTRRGITYSITVSVCAIDDPRDGIGSHATGTWCTTTASGPDDANPQDFKQTTAEVRWVDGTQNKVVTQRSLRSTNGAADAPVVTAFSTSTANFGTATEPVITDPATTSMAFSATASASATQMIWSIDGADQTPVLTPGAGQTATFTWNFGAGKSDGDYEIGVRAVDNIGAQGPTRTITVRIIRGVPTAITGIRGGENIVTIGGSSTRVIELDWLHSPERNVVGYRVFDPGGALVCPSTATAFDKTPSCVDTSPVFGTYTIRPVYMDRFGTAQMGATATKVVSVPVNPIFLRDGVPTTQTGCPPGPKLLSTTSAVDTWMGLWAAQIFCSETPTAPMQIRAGDWRLSTTVQNRHNAQDCTVETSVSKANASAALTTMLGAQSVSVPKNSSQTLTLGPTAMTAQTLAVGERFVVRVRDNGGNCNATDVRVGTTSRLLVPGEADRPPAPVLQPAVRSAAGVQLTWTRPAGISDTAFYRIYRGGVRLDQRIDRTGQASVTTILDPEAPANSTYRVTTVNDDLTESVMSNAVTG